MAIKRPTSYNTGNRDVNTQADAIKSVIKQVDNKFASIEERLVLLQPPGMVFPDAYTYLWWPCTDAIDSGNTGVLVNQTGVSATLTATGSSGNELGLSPGGKGFARIFGASGGYSGAAALTPTGAVSLSAWVRLGAVATKYICGYITGGGTSIFALTTDASGRLVATVNTAAGIKTVGATNDLTLSPSTWHFMWVSFNGTSVTVGLDTHSISSSAFAATTITWTAGAWRLGNAGTNTGEGLYRDVRVHRRAITQSFADDSYAAWHRLEDRNT